MPDDRPLPEEQRQQAERGRAKAEDSRRDAEHDRGATEEHRIAAESARKEAEQFRRLAEEAREIRDQHREALEALRQEREHLREVAETARIAGDEGRAAAEAARGCDRRGRARNRRSATSDTRTDEGRRGDRNVRIQGCESPFISLAATLSWAVSNTDGGISTIRHAHLPRSVQIEAEGFVHYRSPTIRDLIVNG
jgi:hypothetical protein